MVDPAAVGSFNDLPKGSIGNYKGVMLCNRPDAFGGQRKVDRTGALPFSSRVDPKVPIGWNPAPRLVAKVKKVKGKLYFSRPFLFVKFKTEI